MGPGGTRDGVRDRVGREGQLMMRLRVVGGWMKLSAYQWRSPIRYRCVDPCGGLLCSETRGSSSLWFTCEHLLLLFHGASLWRESGLGTVVPTGVLVPLSTTLPTNSILDAFYRLMDRCRHEDKLRCSSLSNDHKPEDAPEKRRIEAAGGEVVFNGCYRVQHEDVRSWAHNKYGTSESLLFFGVRIPEVATVLSRPPTPPFSLHTVSTICAYVMRIWQ